ncbi:MAG: dimethylargininase [Chloroflexi bacterium]|nr:dimethylargininase [Chloroflexota bacterium]
MHIAITREVSPAIGRCELTHLDRRPIDVTLAQAQHRQYEECLTALGCRVERLPAEPDLPDSVFVEDTAIVLDELAVITRPGAASRRPETASVARALASYRPLHHIQAPGTLDGGDVLRLGHTLFVGQSGRSNAVGIDQLRALLRPWGYRVEAVPVTGCLHLKSAVAQVAPNTLLINRDWVPDDLWADWDLIDVDPAEPFAANALLVGDGVIYPAAYPATRERLRERGIRVRPVDVSELIKAEGGVTCCSLILAARP